MALHAIAITASRIMNDLYDAISISGFYGTRIFVYFFNFDVSFAAVSRDVTFSRTEFILICLI